MSNLATPENIRELQRKLYTKAKREPKFRFYLLYDKVCRRDILEHAYRVAKSNGGAAGVDRQSFTDIERVGLEAWLAKIEEELKQKTYKPQAVRRVMIPKPGGGERPLGIPTIRDRVVQTATKLVIEPIFEADLEDSAYGYRPGKSAVGAVKEVHEALCDGYTEVVDADLSKYFDTIPHRELLHTVAKRIVDKHILHLIKMWLKVPVEERDEQGRPRMSGGRKTKTGTPQGGVISPLLANIYINRMLRAWRERGLEQKFQGKIIAYADDFVVLSREKAQDAMQWIAWAVSNLGLVLNTEKTKLRDARREMFDFLGYSFGPTRHRKDGHWYLSAQPSKISQARLKAKLRLVLQRGNVAPIEEVTAKVNRILRGWSNYFCHGTRTIAYRAIDNFVYQRVREFLRRRHKIGSRGTRLFSDAVVFNDLGFLRLRTVQLGPRVRAA